MRITCPIVTSESDINAVATLGHEIWSEHYTPLIGAEQVAYMLDKFQSAAVISKQIAEGYTYRSVFVDGRMAGYCGVVPEAQGKLFLSKLYVHKDFRAKGVGKILFTQAVAPFAQKEAITVRLTVNKYNAGSIAAYKKLGFTVARELVTDIGNGYIMDDYEMTRSVSQGEFQTD